MNIKTLVHKIRYGSTVEWYNFWYIALRRRQKVIPRVASIDETIQTVIDKHCAGSRYGDGEMLLTCADKKIGFQKGNPQLAARLRVIIITFLC